MGAAEATESDQRSAWRADCHAAVVGGGSRFRILRAENAVRTDLWRTGGGDRFAHLDGTIHGDYFSRRGVECGSGGEPQRSARGWLRNSCTRKATPAIRETNARCACHPPAKWLSPRTAIPL